MLSDVSDQPTAALPCVPVPTCTLQIYSQLEGGSHVVNTAWAMLALLAAGYHTVDPKPLHK
jgi:hypothetical protein